MFEKTRPYLPYKRLAAMTAGPNLRQRVSNDADEEAWNLRLSTHHLTPLGNSRSIEKSSIQMNHTQL